MKKTDGYGAPTGTLGTILAGYNSGTDMVLGQWDGWSGGHDGNCGVKCGGTCVSNPMNGRWWVYCDKIVAA